MTYRSSTAYFAVVPYELRNAGCKAAATSFDSVTTVVSHELVEGITDPGVGLDRLAWYDPANGEAADICAGASSAAPVIGGDGVRYMVQRIWSNRAGRVHRHRASPTHALRPPTVGGPHTGYRTSAGSDEDLGARRQVLGGLRGLAGTRRVDAERLAELGLVQRDRLARFPTSRCRW